jgi:hypothetical protein
MGRSALALMAGHSHYLNQIGQLGQTAPSGELPGCVFVLPSSCTTMAGSGISGTGAGSWLKITTHPARIPQAVALGRSS